MTRTALLLPILAALSLMPTRVSAATLASVCNRFSNADTITRCFAAARGLPVDEKAMDVCNRFSDADSIVGCVDAASGREYSQEEIASCNRFSDADSIRRCLSSAGRLARRGGHGGGGACRDHVSREMRECRRGARDARSVLDCLERAFGLD